MPLVRISLVKGKPEPGDLVYDSNYLGIARSSNRRIAVNLVEWRRRTGRSATASPRTRRRRPQP